MYLDRAEAIVGEFDQIDPGSFAFRYPVAKDGAPSLQTRTISMANLRGVVEELADVLDATAAALLEHLDIKREEEEEAPYSPS